MSTDLLSIARSPVSLNDQVVKAVREAIATGGLAPGQRLTEREMMERTGVGRTSIREAMNQLRTMGLVEERHGGGLQVATLDRSTIEHIYEVRAAIESTAAELFTMRASDEEVAELLEASGFGVEVEGELDVAKISLAPGSFEELLLRGARNPLLREVIEPFYIRIQRIRQLSLTMPGRYLLAVAEQNEILEAISRRDPAGAALKTREHIAAAQASALAALDQA